MVKKQPMLGTIERSLSRAKRHSKNTLSIGDLRGAGEEQQWHEGFYKNFRGEGLCRRRAQESTMFAPRMNIYGRDSAAGAVLRVYRSAHNRRASIC